MNQFAKVLRPTSRKGKIVLLSFLIVSSQAVVCKGTKSEIASVTVAENSKDATAPLLQYNAESTQVDTGITESLIVSIKGKVSYTIQVSSASSAEDNRTRTYEVNLNAPETDSLNYFLDQQSIKKLSSKFTSKEKSPGLSDFTIEIIRHNKKQSIRVSHFSPYMNHYPSGLLDLACRIDELENKVTQGVHATHSWCSGRDVHKQRDSGEPEEIMSDTFAVPSVATPTTR